MHTEISGAFLLDEEGGEEAIRGSEGKQKKGAARTAERTVCPSTAAHKIWWEPTPQTGL